jgi:mono/diheme cytochrome c family protein
MRKRILVSLTGIVAAMAALAARATFNEYQVSGGGWTLYKKSCSGCHGLDGDGVDTAGPELRGSAFLVDNEVEVIKGVIRRGRIGASRRHPELLDNPEGFTNMPAFDSTRLSDDQLDVLAKWLKYGMPQR